MGAIRSYEDLVAWQKSYKLVLTVYKLTRGFPTDERFGLTSQVRRAAVSVPSNIAEGWGRGSRADYVRFVEIARGSIYELQTQMKLAADLEYIPPQHEVHEQMREVERLINALIRSLRRAT